jgi:hypothetical protein
MSVNLFFILLFLYISHIFFYDSLSLLIFLHISHFIFDLLMNNAILNDCLNLLMIFITFIHRSEMIRLLFETFFRILI